MVCYYARNWLVVHGYWSETAAYNGWFREEFGHHTQWIKKLMEKSKMKTFRDIIIYIIVVLFLGAINNGWTPWS